MKYFAHWKPHLIFGLLITLLQPAMAAGPVTTKFQVHDEFMVNCGSFELLDVADFVVTRRSFFDEGGSLVRREAHIAVLGTITNTTTGTSVIDRSVDNRLFDFQSSTPTVATTGVIFHINVPGKGVVLLEAGRLGQDLSTGDVLFKAGPSGESTADLCAALQ